MASDEDKENDGVAYRIGVLPTCNKARKPRTQDRDADDFWAKMTDISLPYQAKAALELGKAKRKGKRKICKELAERGHGNVSEPRAGFYLLK